MAKVTMHKSVVLIFFLFLLVPLVSAELVIETHGEVAQTTTVTAQDSSIDGAGIGIVNTGGVAVTIQGAILDTSAGGSMPRTCQIKLTNCGNTISDNGAPYTVNMTTGTVAFTYDGTWNESATLFVPGQCGVIVCGNFTGTRITTYNNTWNNSLGYNSTYISFTNNFTQSGIGSGTLNAPNRSAVIKSVILNSSGLSLNSPTAAAYPFSVVLNNTVGLTANMLVDANFSESFFNYGLVCSVTNTPLWDEYFTLGYNFTTRNVSLNVNPPEDLLTFSGITYTINSSQTQLNLFKSGNEAYRDLLTLDFGFSASVNSTWDIILLSDTGGITGYYLFNKTGTNITIYKNLFGMETVEYIGSKTVTNNVFVSIAHTPAYDATNDISYFNTLFTINNETVGQSSTYQFMFTGQNIKDVQAYTATYGTFTVKQLSLRKTSNLYPTLSQFQNGVEINIGGVTTTVEAPNNPVNGDGFTIVTGYNDEFYPQCLYAEEGTYTQRHYIGAPNDASDYSNYHDLTVAVIDGTDTDEDGNVADGDDTGQAGVLSFLDSIFLGSTTGKFFAGLVMIVVGGALSFFVASSAFPGGQAFAMIAGVVGMVGAAALVVIMGLIPIWVIIMMVILAGAIVAGVFRKLFSGD